MIAFPSFPSIVNVFFDLKLFLYLLKFATFVIIVKIFNHLNGKRKSRLKKDLKKQHVSGNSLSDVKIICISIGFKKLVSVNLYFRCS